MLIDIGPVGMELLELLLVRWLVGHLPKVAMDSMADHDFRPF